VLAAAKQSRAAATGGRRREVPAPARPLRAPEERVRMTRLRQTIARA
jgi:pyruvate/2-oxoglutarate dehydrogenase complex dihydrolipoamide acyltransferase (E2) component